MAKGQIPHPKATPWIGQGHNAIEGGAAGDDQSLIEDDVKTIEVGVGEKGGVDRAVRKEGFHCEGIGGEIGREGRRSHAAKGKHPIANRGKSRGGDRLSFGHGERNEQPRAYFPMSAV
ncbi:hypothetical protein VB714_26080 [Spirulina sp. 06S082]|nr:hypothetical protein [Spirulina sp. 06S082]